MSNTMLAVVSFGDGSACTGEHSSPLRCGVGSAYRTEVPARGEGMPSPYMGAVQAEDAMYLRLLEEKAKNRVMGVQLECASALLRVREERATQKKRVRKAAMKLLGWFGFGLCWGVCAMACWYFAPKWTCIAPAVLMGLAWWKAGGEV